MRLIGVDEEYSEDLDGPALPDWVEEVMAKERAWWRFLRGAEAISVEVSPTRRSEEPLRGCDIGDT